MQKFGLLFRFCVSPCHPYKFPLQMTTSTKTGLNFDRWILMDKNALEARNLFTENWNLLSFYVFNFQVIPLAATERTTTVIKIPLLCFVYLGFGWGKCRNGDFSDGCFCLVNGGHNYFKFQS